MRLIDHRAARAEFLEATRFYRQSSPALARRFLDAMTVGLASIQEHPERRRFISPDVRVHRISSFLYTILSRVKAAHLEIVAYKHDSRQPDYWRDRLND